MKWITEFIKSFGGEGNLFRNPGDGLADYNTNMSNQNAGQAMEENRDRIDDSDRAKLSGTDPQTGDRFELEVKRLKKHRDKTEQKWIDREKDLVTITNLDNSKKFINSTLDTLCGGKYAGLSTKPLDEVAKTLAADYGEIFDYVDASLANYANYIDAKQAFRLAQSVSANGKISHLDYEKLTGKLDKTGVSELDKLLAGEKTRVVYPLEVIEKSAKVSIHTLEYKPGLEIDCEEEMKNIKAEVEDEKEVAYKLNSSNYHLAYIKDFKEYRMGTTTQLRGRVQSVIASLSSMDKHDLLTAMKGDRLLKDIL